MPDQRETIIEAFRALGGARTIKEIDDWVSKKHGRRWKNFGTPMADMVPLSLGGNPSSTVPDKLRVLERVSKGTYRLISQPSEKEDSSRKGKSIAIYDKLGEPVSYEVNGAKRLLGKTFDEVRQVICSAKSATHQGILNSFREAGWSTEVSLLGSYRCDAYKDGVVVEIESIDKSSVIDVLHRDLFRFQMLQRMGKLKVAVLITRISGGEVSLEKVKKDMEVFGKHYEIPLLVFGVQ